MQASISEQSGTFSQFSPMVDQGIDIVDPLDSVSQDSPFRVVIVESSVPLARLLATGLLTECSAVEVVHDLSAGLNELENIKSDLLILDLDIPDMDAPGVLRRVRAQRPGIRVLALSRRDGIQDLVTALDGGADDYLSKPFSLLELMARVRALRRRSQAGDRTPVQKRTSLVLHRGQCQVERDGRLIDLTPREYNLLECLMQNPGKTLSRAVLTQMVWNMPAEGNTNIVDVYVKYLRDKLDGDDGVKLIRTVRGVGYSYQPETEQ